MDECCAWQPRRSRFWTYLTYSEFRSGTIIEILQARRCCKSLRKNLADDLRIGIGRTGVNLASRLNPAAALFSMAGCQAQRLQSWNISTARSRFGNGLCPRGWSRVQRWSGPKWLAFAEP